MIGLDTNVLLRLLTRDDLDQAKAAHALVDSRCRKDDPGYVNAIVLCELVWVLARGHRYGREAIADVIQRLLDANDLVVEHEREVTHALDLYREAGRDFADILIAEINLRRGCSGTATFDPEAARLPGFLAV